MLWVVIYPLLERVPDVEIMMYANDLNIFSPFAYKPGILQTVTQVLHEFWDFSRLRLNIKKTAAIARNLGSGPWVEAFQKEGSTVRDWVRYLGIRLGRILPASDKTHTDWGLTLDQAFAPVLHECLRRARIVSSSSLQLPGRIFVLKIRILPVLGWSAKAYCPSESVIRQVKMIYRVALRLHS